MKILLIAGHGAGDSGAPGNGYKEADLTREMVKLIKPKLEKYCDVDVADTSKNWYEYYKTAAGKKFNFGAYDYVFEVHFNACVQDFEGNGKTTGTEVYITKLEKGWGVETLILDNMSALGFKNRGVIQKNYSLIYYIKSKFGVSSALFETCFIDDIDDMKLYASKKEKIADAVVNGIVKGFGLKQLVLTEPDEIIQKLSQSIEIHDVKGAISALKKAKTENSSLYWLLYKVVNK